MNRSVVIQELETKAKRKIVISDIHGNLDLYLKLLDQISYKPNEDCLILLGDLIEKGKIIEVASKIGDKKSKSIHEKNIEK